MVDDPLRTVIERALGGEPAGWAAEQVARVTAVLERDVEVDARRTALVVDHPDDIAFTGPGYTVYVSRRLLDRLPDDHAAAIVIARELAHHRLGHVPAIPGAAWRVVEPRFAIAALRRWHEALHRAHDADLLAIEICIDAGFDAERCLAALAHLTEEADIHTRAHGVPAAGLAVRLDAMRAHVTAVGRGERLPVNTLRARELRRTRQFGLVTLGAVATLGLALWRRR